MSLESVDHGNRNVLILSFSVYVRLFILTFQYRLWYSIYFPHWCLLKDIICFFLIKFNFIIVCFLFFYKTFFTEILVAFSYKKKNILALCTFICCMSRLSSQLYHYERSSLQSLTLCSMSYFPQIYFRLFIFLTIITF